MVLLAEPQSSLQNVGSGVGGSKMTREEGGTEPGLSREALVLCPTPAATCSPLPYYTGLKASYSVTHIQ